MPTFRRKPVVVEAVQWTGDAQAWPAICDLPCNSELVAFREQQRKRPAIPSQSAMCEIAHRPGRS
jgi:hypothetical protein